MVWTGATSTANVAPGGGQHHLVDQASEVLEMAVEEFDTMAFLWTGGKEANAIADMLLYGVDGANGRSPVPFVTIDTGNQYDAMYDFRKQYAAPTGDRGASTVGPPTGLARWDVLRYDDLLDGVVQNDDDPRGYHGEWRAGVDLPDKGPVDGLPRTPEEWGVEESCGALKVVPMRRYIRDHDVDALITGRRGEDPLTPDDGLQHFEERREPAAHTRINPLAEWSEPNVYAYIKQESVSLPSLYTNGGVRHTDATCCTDDDAVGEYGEGGRDPEKRQARDRLEDMGYV